MASESAKSRHLNNISAEIPGFDQAKPPSGTKQKSILHYLIGKCIGEGTFGKV